MPILDDHDFDAPLDAADVDPLGVHGRRQLAVDQRHLALIGCLIIILPNLEKLLYLFQNEIYSAFER